MAFKRSYRVAGDLMIPAASLETFVGSERTALQRLNSSKTILQKVFFSAILFHAIFNLSGFVLPNNGNPYTAISWPIFAVTAFIAVFLWVPKTLAQYRYARPAL